MTPAWIVCAWPPVLWQAALAPEFQLVHLGTRVLDIGRGPDACSAGQTLWGEESPERSAGVAWDWVEIGKGIVAMSDPLGMVTNLRLVGQDGVALTPGQIALHLHQLVHALPWQTEVRRALDQPAATDEPVRSKPGPAGTSGQTPHLLASMRGGAVRTSPWHG